jgi:hypothetical protein
MLLPCCCPLLVLLLLLLLLPLLLLDLCCCKRVQVCWLCCVRLTDSVHAWCASNAARRTCFVKQ